MLGQTFVYRSNAFGINQLGRSERPGWGAATLSESLVESGL